MSEEISMKQKAIDVVLLAADEETDLLRFEFEDNPLDVNLNSPLCQNELKAVFVCLLQMIIENDVFLEFKHADDYGRGLYIEVCEEYVKDLNRELASAKEKIRKEME